MNPALLLFHLSFIIPFEGQITQQFLRTSHKLPVLSCSDLQQLAVAMIHILDTTNPLRLKSHNQYAYNML